MKNKIYRKWIIFVLFFSLGCAFTGAQAQPLNTRNEQVATCISSGRYNEAINILLGMIKNNPGDKILSERYLARIDDISLIFHLAERLNLPEEKLKSMLSPYTAKLNNPETFQEFVIALEYRLTYRHLENIEAMFNHFKKYLHTNFGFEGTTERQNEYLYYYPYLMARYLFLKGEYNKSEQYSRLALMYRPHE